MYILIFIISLNIDDNLGDVNIYINMEINNWYQNPNEISFASYGPAGNNDIMQNMPMQHKLQANGAADLFTVSVR